MISDTKNGLKFALSVELRQLNFILVFTVLKKQISAMIGWWLISVLDLSILVLYGLGYSTCEEITP